MGKLGRCCAATVAFAAVAAGCSSQPAMTQGSVTSCFQFGVEAIQRHVTVTALPAACQGLSQLEVNEAVSRALHAAAAGVRGKSRQRQVIASDIRYLTDLLRTSPATSQPATSQPVVATPQASLPSQGALGLAALVTWLLTVGLGVSMMARWITRVRRRGAQPDGGRGPVLNFTHFGLALTGLAIWICYLATSMSALAWTACGLLIPAASLGMTLVFLAPDRDPGPSATTRFPSTLIVAVHITAAVITVLLTLLAAIGS